jgi:hypothetical protein
MRLINDLITIEEARQLILDNKVLTIAGSEKSLDRLPKGQWIGGSIPYFMTDNGGCFNEEMVFVSDLTPICSSIRIKTYNTKNVNLLPKNQYPNGFAYLIMPAFSAIHSHYALSTPVIPGLMNTPVFGWISGVDIVKLGDESPIVVDGSTLKKSDEAAVCMHIELIDSLNASIEIINIFQQDHKSDTITFDEVGFSCTECRVNGKKTNLAAYLKDNNIDTQLPLVADFSGTAINVSLQSVNKTSGVTTFYAPVQPGIDYKFASHQSDYLTAFNHAVGSVDSQPALSCNCILNYLYSNLEGKKTGRFCGPVTFGEIAYMLVNQTLVYLNIN